MPNDSSRCQCGYKLVNGVCPIPCRGRPLSELANRYDPATGAGAVVPWYETGSAAPLTYWTPKESAA